MIPRALLVIIWGLMALTSTCSSRNLGDSSSAQSSAPLSGFVIPIKMRHGHFKGHEARVLLVNGTVPLHGAVKDLG